MLEPTLLAPLGRPLAPAGSQKVPRLVDGLLLAQGPGSLSLGHISTCNLQAGHRGGARAQFPIVNSTRRSVVLKATAMAVLALLPLGLRMALGETQHLVGDIVEFLAVRAVVGSWDADRAARGPGRRGGQQFATDFYNQVFQPMLSACGNQQMEARRAPINLSFIQAGWRRWATGTALASAR